MVLPGLDTDLDEDVVAADRAAIESKKASPPAPGHPQFAMQALLARIGIARDAVVSLGAAARTRAAGLRSAAAGGGDRHVAAKRRRARRSTRMPMPRSTR